MIKIIFDLKLFSLCLLFFTKMVQYKCFANVDLGKIRNEEVLIVQFDSRPLKGYWLTSALWNNYYALKHNHTYVYYSTKGECAHGLEPLAPPWCKVKAMLQVDNDFPDHKIFIYMDSDAVINKRYLDTSVPKFTAMMQKELEWNPTKRPLVFNQDGKCWWCTLTERVGYTMCLNAGTVMWYKNPISNQLLKQWWDASLDPYEGNPIKRRFRLKWPWEQDRQMALYNTSSHLIQVASQPDRSYLYHSPDWCLSHLPKANCFVQHFCENQSSKKRMMTEYALSDEFASLKKKSVLKTIQLVLE